MRVDLATAHGLTPDWTPEVLSAERQILIPIASTFYFKVGRREAICDPNQVLMIPPGLVSRDRRLADDHVRAIIITLADDHLEELVHPGGEGLARFGDLTIPASHTVQRLAAALVRGEGEDGLTIEDAALRLLRAALGAPVARTETVGPRPLRLVAAVKEMLAQATEPLSLTRIGRTLGVSPVYLAEIFHRAEGTPIGRYQRRLRLTRALALLPETDDIAGLALDLGFSSHSHFTAAFRAAHGVTPSAYRGAPRRRTRPPRRRGPG
ncbi:AraC family transcriptional regulator [Phenylobacterium sp.]|uniref:helix-turn-helix transcriptional regulator n=1 Tax=Phenylobacterium sp. TaxID=1871053 RepID=UPI0027329F29|nr:AraC family transcriptional regulator [Phenylobacterium sp.]MDP3854289.1 AraC family transcriptional regulator [Phenylobacterium sp.]